MPAIFIIHGDVYNEDSEQEDIENKAQAYFLAEIFNEISWEYVWISEKRLEILGLILDILLREEEIFELICNLVELLLEIGVHFIESLGFVS